MRELISPDKGMLEAWNKREEERVREIRRLHDRSNNKLLPLFLQHNEVIKEGKKIILRRSNNGKSKKVSSKRE